MGTEQSREKAAKVEFYAITDRGTREYQQDAGHVEAEGPLAMAVLCDGMGGMNGGEKASNLSVGYFARDVKDAWPISDIPEFLRKEAKRLDRAVFGLQDEKGGRLNAGTTIVSVIVVERDLYWMSVGDSRIYILRNGTMRCLTAAHNYKTMLKQKLMDGLIDMDYYNGEIQQGEALTSYLGLGNVSLIDSNPAALELKPGDTILLCSDGLYKTLTDEQIQVLIQESGGTISLAGQRLIETAKRWGKNGQDNTTLILLKITGETES